MSDAANNRHPYRGACDEMIEDNDEFNEALEIYYKEPTKADVVKADIELYKKTVMFAL